MIRIEHIVLPRPLGPTFCHDVRTSDKGVPVMAVLVEVVFPG